MESLSKVEGNFAGMKCRATFDEYLGDPIGSYTVGPMCLLWCHSARLSGIALWGRLERQHAPCFMHARSVCVDPRQCLCVIDLRRVKFMDSSVLASLTECLRTPADVPNGCVPAVALLRPDGIYGVTLAGLCNAYDFSCRVKVFTEPHEALVWLGEADASPFVNKLDDALCRVTSPDSVLSALRAYLDQNPGKADLTTVAAALGTSGRALQRRLKAAHTSFQAELNAAQIQLAKHLLYDTNNDIKQVAFEVGCSSVAAFSALFRRIEGEAPSAWRTRRWAGSFADLAFRDVTPIGELRPSTRAAGLHQSNGPRRRNDRQQP